MAPAAAARRAEAERATGINGWLAQGAADLTLWHFFGAFVTMRLAFEFLKPYILPP